MADEATRYAEALAFAREFLARDVWACDWACESFRAVAVSDNLEWQFSMVGRELPADINAEEFDYWSGWAAHRLRLFLNGELGATSVMPTWLAGFAADVLEGKRERPTKRGPPEFKNMKRDWAFWRAVGEVRRRYGFDKRRGAKNRMKLTAVDVVSEAACVSVDMVLHACRNFRDWDGPVPRAE